MSKLNISDWELEELIPMVFGLSEEEVEKLINDQFDLEEWLHEKLMDNCYESLTELVHKLINGLMPMIFVGRSPLTDTLSKGFGVQDGDAIRKICGIEV
jgi:hypothetical protein